MYILEQVLHSANQVIFSFFPFDCHQFLVGQLKEIIALLYVPSQNAMKSWLFNVEQWFTKYGPTIGVVVTYSKFQFNSVVSVLFIWYEP